MPQPAPIPATIAAIEQPIRPLWTYYVLKALASTVALPATLPLYYFRFHTLRYRFDAEGIHMRWGIIFRHEVMLNYSRIQDIHLRSNFVERYLGLARIIVETAAGGANADMVLEGLPDPEAMRDFLYSRMRGVKESVARPPGAAATADSGQLAAALHDVALELRAIREHLEKTPRV